MASVINKTTFKFLGSENTPDYLDGNWIINPDLSAVAGVPQKYWKVVGNAVQPMTTAERLVVDQASAVSSAPQQYAFDDFIGSIPASWTSKVNSDQSIAAIASYSNVRLRAKAVSGSYIEFFAPTVLITTAKNPVVGFQFNESTLTNQIVSIGAYADTNNSALFRRTDAGTWNIVTRGAGVEQLTDLGIPGDTNQHIFEIRVTATSIQYWMDGVQRGTTITTNLPAVTMFPYARVEATAGVPSFRDLFLDYSSVKSSR